MDISLLLFAGIIGLYWGISYVDKIVTIDKFKAGLGAILTIIALIVIFL